MFAEEQAKGRTRIIDPDLDAVSSPQRARNYSEPSPFPATLSTVGVTPTHGHHRSPLSVHPTTTSSRNRTSASTPSAILLSDRRAPIVSGTSNSSPATFTSNPRSALDISPSMRRFQMIQAALEQEAGSGPVTPRGQGQVRSPLLSNAITSNFRSFTPVPGPSSSSRTRALERAATTSPGTFRNSTYSPGSDPSSASRRRESASTSVGFDARAPSVNSRHPSHTNTYTHTKPNTTTGGARTSNPTIPIKSTSEPPSSSRGLQRTRPLSPDTFHSTSRLAVFDSLGRSSASPRAVVRTPKWLPPYPTARTPSPDSDSSPRTKSSSPGPSDELLSPLSNVNLNSFALDDHPHRDGDTVERNTLSAFDSSTRHSTPRTRRVNTQSQSPPVFGTPSTSTSARSVPVRIIHNSDPRSPILGGNQSSELTHKR
jgi:hypothetical protein